MATQSEQNVARKANGHKPKTRQAALALVADVMRAQEITVEEVAKRLAANPARQRAAGDMVAEMRGGAVYMYVPLGNHIVASPKLCGGRPTIYGTRIDARHVLDLLNHGYSVSRVARDFSISTEAVKEVQNLAEQIDYERAYA
jgi:uncharacterized protein (DUF433 family)